MPAYRVGNFLPKSDLLYINRTTLELADRTLVNPENALAIYDGEWLTKNGSGKGVRASTIGSLGNASTSNVAYPCFSERGRTDTQSLPEPGVDVINGGTDTIWNTTIFDAAVTIGSGAQITAFGQPLKIATISLSSPQGTRNFTGLVGHGGSGDSAPIVATVEELPANNGGKLKIKLGGRKLEPAGAAPQEKTMEYNLAESLTQKLASTDGQQKLAAEGGKFILDRLRERSFARPILRARNIKPDECQISASHDTLTKLEWIEPGARAMTMGFRGLPDAELISMPRAVMGFHTVSSAIFQKTEQELQVYRDVPLTKLIEDNSLKDMEELQDRTFLLHIEAAVQGMQADANSLAAAPTLNASALQGASPPIEFSVLKSEAARQALSNTLASFPLKRPDIQNLRSMLTDNRLRGELLLMTESDWNQVSSWTLEDMGDKMQSETLVDGYKYSTLMGLKYVKSIKNDILRKGNIYLFTDADFLGRFYILNNTKFYVDKRFNVISWMAWEDIGMLLMNVGAVKKLELYAGDATLNDADGVRSRYTPVATNSLGQKNNRVVEGLTYPAVTGSYLAPLG